jgi:hypothetical protein
LRTTIVAFSLCYFAITQSVNMITTMAMNCSSTRSRMSFCEVLPEPPRIILMSPSSSTTATAPIAIGTATWDMKSAMTTLVAFLKRGRNPAVAPPVSVPRKANVVI